MTAFVDIQNATQQPLPLSEEQLLQFVHKALTATSLKADVELTIRLVNTPEITELNLSYRNQNKPTNVLAFPSDLPGYIELEEHFLGDVIICPEVLVTESIDLHKSLIEHWALIVIHGVLHLLGYDHITDEDTASMQQLEINFLNALGYTNPYLIEEH